MSGLADNPFNDNPFAVNTSNVSGSVPAAAPGAWNSSMAGAWGGTGSLSAAPSRGAYAAPTSAPPVSNGRKALNEAELSAREAALNKRENELHALELQLRNAGGVKSVKNWPRYCSCIHHDINGEIPAAMQGVVRSGYYAYVGLVICLLWNFLGTAANLIANGAIAPFLWGGLYLMGIPAAWWLWYGRLYSGAIKDSAFAYGTFFLTFIPAHLVFVAWSAIAPPILNSTSHTGFWVAISSVYSNNAGVGIIYFIGAGLWSLEFLWSFWTLKRVYTAFRGKGMTAADVKSDAARQAVANAV